MKIMDFDKTTLEKLRKSPETEKARPVRKAERQAGATKTDQVSISRKSREIQKLEAILANTPDIRKDKVDEIKRKLDSGQYRVDAREVARKILKEI